MTISIASRYAFPRSSFLHFDQNRERIELVTSNALAAMGGRMQLLLHGWLIVAWGHSILFLFAFAAARLLPKLILTVPAGLICDRFPRARVLAAARLGGAVACLLPLAGFVLPLPLFWLITGIVISGVAHVFDQPARKATLGDITCPEELGPVIAINNAGSHGASLCGSVLAFAFGPPGLAVAAAFLIGAALLARALPAQTAACDEGTGKTCGLDQFFHFMVAAPAVSGILVLGIMPPLLDKGLALSLPSFHEGWATMSLALLAPDVGAIAAALLLFVRPVRLSFGWIALSVVCYALLLFGAFTLLADPALLVGGLALAGIAKSVFDTTSQLRVQQIVPAGLRGRVFAL